MGMIHQGLRFFRGTARLLANHCLIPSLRHALFRLSGFEIGPDAFLNMEVRATDDYEKGLVRIGPRVAVAPNVTFVAISNPNNSALNKFPEFSKRGAIVIEEDAWIGTGVVVMPGVRIGRGAVVVSNAVVTRNVPAYNMVGGIPARTIRLIDSRADPEHPLG